MFKNKIFLVLAIVAVAFVVYTFMGNETQTNTPEKQSEYAAQVEKERRKKDDFFRKSADSPLENKANFAGLDYYKPQIDYRTNAEVLPYEGKDVEAVVPMTDSSSETYQKYGYARFSVHDAVYKLLIYEHDDVLSILFRDQTAPKETYGGGRYVDIPLKDVVNKRFTLDFNAAYNPYCAYNYRYACPLPPKENLLPTRIEAGEKSFKRPEWSSCQAACAVHRRVIRW